MRPFVVCMCLVAVCAVAVADDCEHSKPINVELDAAGATSLQIDAPAGFLIVQGESGAGQVTVEGRACASSERMLDDIELVTDRNGERLLVEVDIPEFNFSWRGYARLDLTVAVPSDLALRIKDGSGSIEISSVASVDLEDGSGEIEISDVYGDVQLSDGSGEIELRDITGRVTLLDGSGSLVVSNVGGVHVEEDGSGEIRITQVQGDVEIEEDGSGGITVRDVTGAVRVGSDGSGSIWIAQVGGDFELGSDGSGSVHVDDVRGTVKMP